MSIRGWKTASNKVTYCRTALSRLSYISCRFSTNVRRENVLISLSFCRILSILYMFGYPFISLRDKITTFDKVSYVQYMSQILDYRSLRGIVNWADRSEFVRMTDKIRNNKRKNNHCISHLHGLLVKSNKNLRHPYMPLLKNRIQLYMNSFINLAAIFIQSAPFEPLI